MREERFEFESLPEMANRVLQQRGYLVVASEFPHPIGFVFQDMGEEDMFLNEKTVIVAETDYADMIQQRAETGVGHRFVPDGFHFYRVIAE